MNDSFFCFSIGILKLLKKEILLGFVFEMYQALSEVTKTDTIPLLIDFMFLGGMWTSKSEIVILCGKML